jgi:SAM-dependent methyltransferase
VSAGDGCDSHVADDVRDFYDRYPYPPPVESLEPYQRLWRQPPRRRADYHLFWPSASYREDFSVLIAGCGTSQAARHAVRWPAAQVTGIDVSATSVRFTEALKRKHDLRNLQVHQLSIERARELGTSFDQIVCTGVLHHLEDPEAGLAALGDVLKPDGVMHLMVYAPYGRTGIYMLQEFCRRVGIHATDEGIRDLVVALRELPRGHPLGQLLQDAPDFRDEAALADALLHPQDRAYSVPQLFDLIENADLRFGRWIKQAPYSPRCGLMAHLPQASRLSALPIVDQFSAVELFRGTMLRHSLVAYRRDSAGNEPISFASDAVLDYVPIRIPDTICVHDRLAPGAAAVLINPTHTYSDLVLPIDTLELQMFDAIDGTRCLGEILDDTLPDTADTATRFEKGRRFFDRLWHHDQIVVDAASAGFGAYEHVTRHHSVGQPDGSSPGVSHALETHRRGLQP